MDECDVLNMALMIFTSFSELTKGDISLVPFIPQLVKCFRCSVTFSPGFYSTERTHIFRNSGFQPFTHTHMIITKIALNTHLFWNYF